MEDGAKVSKRKAWNQELLDPDKALGKVIVQVKKLRLKRVW